MAPVDAAGEPAAQSEPVSAAPDAHRADASTHEEPVAVADTVTPAAAGSEADATAGLAADDAELPTFAE